MQTNSKIKVLICDDDKTQLLLLEKTLSKEGYAIEKAVDGEQALSAFERVKPDIILLDVNMPKRDGYSVCERIRASKQGLSIPILMITGSDNQQSIEKAFEAGATDFLPKPIKWGLIQHRIKYMLRSYNYQQNLQKREEDLRFLAYYDSLTRLPNRQYFSEHLERSIKLAKRNHSNTAVLFINLDSFKRINDTLGYAHGDRVLKTVSKRLKSQLRSSDVISRDGDYSEDMQLARHGGDEFTIVLNHCDSVDAVAEVAKRMINQISQPIVLEHYNLVLTASIGISIYPIDGNSVEDLLKYADMAMHSAKESGKSCYRLHSKELNERSMNRLKLEEYMREALVTQKFELYYQPQVSLKDKSIEGAEALLRLHHDELGLISPGEFIPVAEDTGLIVEIGYWVIEQACAQVKSWEQQGLEPLKISVNVSIMQITQPNFIDKLREILVNSEVDPSLIDLELTETIMMKNALDNIRKLQAIKKLGVLLSIDDFGTGFSSLNYLKQFPIDSLKIDRSFIVALEQKDAKQDIAIIKAIAAMADAMELKIIVEGVETQGQLESIKTFCNVDATKIQGFFYSKPLAIDKFDQFKLDFA